jgi:hypothetical protein
MEVTGTKPEYIIPLTIQKELGEKNLRNVNDFTQALDKRLKSNGIEAHLILVGGVVDPLKQGAPHKDVDILFYSPQLATETYLGGDHPLFDALARFVSIVSTEDLGWQVKVYNPFFLDYGTATDGEVNVVPPSGLPLEILPVRKANLGKSVTDYLATEKRPHQLLYSSTHG